MKRPGIAKTRVPGQTVSEQIQSVMIMNKSKILYMNRNLLLATLTGFSLFFVTGCDFIGGIFQTGVGVGVFITIAVLVLIFFIARIGRRRP